MDEIKKTPDGVPVERRRFSSEAQLMVFDHTAKKLTLINAVAIVALIISNVCWLIAFLLKGG